MKIRISLWKVWWEEELVYRTEGEFSSTKSFYFKAAVRPANFSSRKVVFICSPLHFPLRWIASATLLGYQPVLHCNSLSTPRRWWWCQPITICLLRLLWLFSICKYTQILYKLDLYFRSSIIKKQFWPFSEDLVWFQVIQKLHNQVESDSDHLNVNL